MTRVLQVLGRSAGGVARHVAQITSGLKEAGDLRIEVAGPADLPVAIQGLAFEVSIPNGPVRGHRAAIAAIRSAIQTFQPHVVHAHGLRAGIDSARAAGHVPVVLSVHNLVRADISGALRASLYRRAEALAVKGSVRVLAPSREIADHLERTVRSAAGKTEVLYLGVGEAPPAARTTDEIRADLGVGGGPLAVTAARLHPQKDLPTMLRAVALVPDLRLVILGEGPLGGELRALTQSLGIQERVCFVGFRDDVFDILRAADLFLLSSVWEAVALAVQEAVLVATPVVATDAGGIPELIEDGVSGLLFPPGDHQAMARAIAEVLLDPAQAKIRASIALEKLRATFSTPVMLDRLASVYRSFA